MSSRQHTGFGDCACEDCWPVEPEMPLADHGEWHPRTLRYRLWRLTYRLGLTKEPW